MSEASFDYKEGKHLLTARLYCDEVNRLGALGSPELLRELATQACVAARILLDAARAADDVDAARHRELLEAARSLPKPPAVGGAQPPQGSGTVPLPRRSG